MHQDEDTLDSHIIATTDICPARKHTSRTHALSTTAIGCVQYFGDIAVLLKKTEPATVRVSSLKVGHWRWLVGEVDKSPGWFMHAVQCGNLPFEIVVVFLLIVHS